MNAGVNIHVPPSLTILLVDDDPAASALMREILAVAFTAGAQPIVVGTTEEAIDHIRQRPADVVLLRVHLRGATGIEPILRIAGEAGAMPVIAITTSDDEEAALAAVRAGAQECLLIDELTPARLRRAILHAIERQRLLNALRATHERERHERDVVEIESLEAFSSHSTTQITAQIYGAAPLREALPGIFTEVAFRYGEIIEQNLEQRLYKVSRGISDQLRGIAEQLGFLRAGPRDVIELHTLALKRKINESDGSGAQAYVEEGRLLVLELMGYLTVYYRNLSLGARRATPPTPVAPVAPSAKDSTDA